MLRLRLRLPLGLAPLRAFSVMVRMERAPAHVLHAESEYFLDEALGDRRVSPWHDIALRAAETEGFNFVCEVPRGEMAKKEICTRSPFNPIVHDLRKDGTRRYYGMPSIVNYGAMPQTYEDPAHKDELTGIGGDGDPLDVCEIGSERAHVGSIYPVKVVGALALVDGGETDWKVGTA